MIQILFLSKKSLSSREVILLRLSQVMLGGFVLVFCINSFLAKQDDFQVFWDAGRNFLLGQPLYDFLRDGMRCYKYPPWITPLFIPFSLLPLGVSDIVWRLCSLICMLYICSWSVRGSKKPYLGILVFLSFWGTWMNNLISGQVTPFLLALALWAYSELDKRRRIAQFVLFLALSAKVFYLVSLVGLGKKNCDKKALIGISLFVSLSTAMALWGYEGSLKAMVHAFLSTSNSLSEVGVSGGDYGLPILWIKALGLSQLKHARILAFLMSFFVLYPCVTWLTPHQVKGRERFCLWLALAAAIHPLQFSYGFLWVVPFVIIVFERVLERNGEKQPIFILASLLGVSGLTFLDRLGFSFLDGLPIRSLSILLLVIIWILKMRGLPQHVAQG